MNLKKLLSVLLAVAMVLSMTAILAGCGDAGENGTDDAVTGEKVSHSISVKSIGGMALEGIEVYVYADEAMSDMEAFAQTDAEGKATVELVQGGEYVIAVSGAPKGYIVEESYSFNGTTAEISLNSALVEGESLSSATLGLGDVMYDFSVVDCEGNNITLSEMLQEKEMVLINFWYEGCGPCANEFPYMEEAYQLYKDKVGIIALNPVDGTPESVAVYKAQMGLTFPMASCQAAWGTLASSGYPTSYVVDRYGVICLVEVGALTSLTPFTSIFEHFTGDDYEQKLCVNGVNDVITVMKPTTTMPSHEEIAAVMGSEELPVTYLNASETDLEYNWPFVIGEAEGEQCIMSSNQEIEGSYSILRMEVELKAGQALGMDYIISSEAGNDVLHVIVDDEPVYTVSGVDEVPQWKSMYPCVAEEDGTYEIALCYIKDDSDNAGTDAAYLKNVRIVDETEIDTATYLSRPAAVENEDGFTYTYADIVLNEKDGYYHVGTEDGPLLLANLMSTSKFNEENYIWGLVYEGGLSVEGVDYSKKLEQYAQYASNSNLSNYCTVTEELAELLKAVDTLYGFDEADTDEWLRCCVYYQAYGSDGEQLEDPIKGLATFSAYTATLGKGVESNHFEYNRIIMPRGLLAEFVPSRSGVYRITSHCDDAYTPICFLFGENRTPLTTQEAPDERMFDYEAEANGNTVVYYLEAGKPYYIDIAFWDPYTEGRIDYDIEYLGASYQSFRFCSPGYFTYDTDASGDAMYHTIAGGIKVVLGDDGIYYEDLGNGKKGSKIYCDFTSTTTIFTSQTVATVQAYDENGNKAYNEDGTPKMIKGLIDLGGFDFSKTEDDQFILNYMAMNDNDPDKTREYLKEYWGADYDSYAEIYQLEDVLKGKYHGTGPDLTEEIRGYLDKMITSGAKELQGCVVVDARLGEILQMLMDKHTFAGVENSWVKMCYFYDYIGANDENVIQYLPQEEKAAQTAEQEEG